MKHFIAQVTYKKAIYCSKAIMTVYQIKRGRPVFVGSCSFNTGATKGEQSEAFQVINDNCKGFKRFFRRSGGYYRPNNILTIDVI